MFRTAPLAAAAFCAFAVPASPALAQDLPTYLDVWPLTFQPYTSISLSVDVYSGGVPFCDTEEWEGVDIYGTNGYWNFWYSNYRRDYFSFTDSLTPRAGVTIGYDVSSFLDTCEGSYGGGDTGATFPADPAPLRLRVLFEGYTGDHGGCPPGTSSPWYYWRGYQVVDQWGNDYRQQTTLSEQIDNYANSCQVPFQPASGQNPVGEFTDRFALCNAPPCMSGGNCEARSYQYLFANGAYVRGTHLTHTCSGFTLVDVFTP